MIYDVLLPTEHAARSIVLTVCYLNILAKRFQPEVRRRIIIYNTSISLIYRLMFTILALPNP